MSSCTHIILKSRGLIGVTGDDAIDFLQGLVSNDVTKVSPDNAIYSALLTPQGKFLYDFFLVSLNDGLAIDCETDRLDDLKRKLSMYKLRSKVDLTDLSGDFCVAALMGENVIEQIELINAEGSAKGYLDGVAYVDPRLKDIGVRTILPREGAIEALTTAGFPSGNPEDYENLRLELGLPDGSRDLEVDKAILLENGFNELHGVDWDKGCYMGQELTARTHYRGLVKKRLMPVSVEGPLPAPGTSLMVGDKVAGEMRSGTGDKGLALVKLEHFASGDDMTAEGAVLHPLKPDWADFNIEP